MEESEADHRALDIAKNKKDDNFLSKFKKSTAFAIVVLLGAAIFWFLDFADKISKFGKSDSLVLAENSEKSKFSDNFVKLAYKRIYLAKRFARRVSDGATGKDIEEAWRRYLDTSEEWNTNLMINIVGLESYYDSRKSEYLEFELREDFSRIDDAIRAVYLSQFVRETLRNPNIESSSTEKGNTSDIENAANIAYGHTYWLIRCIQPTRNKSSRPLNECEQPPP